MNILGSLLGMVGLYKFFLDRSFLQMLSTAQRVFNIVVSGENNSLRPAERQRLLTDISKALWDGESQQIRKDAGLSHRFGHVINELYLYFVPGPVRTLIFFPSLLITYPFRWFLDKKRVDEARDQTRQLAVKGLWSFFVPLGLAYTAAVLLVQEMDYVRVETDLDGVVSKHMVRRIVIGPGRFSLNLPHTLILCVSFRLVIGFAVFHTVSFLFILYNYKDLNSRTLH